MKPAKTILISITLMVGLIWTFRVPLTNVLGIIDDRGYIIPKESSIFSFRILVMNEGSGEWWIYGEDNNNYYFQGNHEYKTGYIVFPKSKVKFCKDFNQVDYATWCKIYIIHSEI